LLKRQKDENEDEVLTLVLEFLLRFFYFYNKKWFAFDPFTKALETLVAVVVVVAVNPPNRGQAVAGPVRRVIVVIAIIVVLFVAARFNVRFVLKKYLPVNKLYVQTQTHAQNTSFIVSVKS